jgi:hypothetical protein
MMRRLSGLLWAAIAVSVVFVAARAWHPFREDSRDLTTASCDGWRWPVKTLSDKRAGLVNLSPRPTTVAALGRLRPPAKLTARVSGVETTTYRLQARLVGIQPMRDGDTYLVIADPRTGRTMITEFPMGWCANSASPAARRSMAQASASLIQACQPAFGSYTHLAGTATLTGVGFFDKKEGQQGIAPNGIELHPVLSFSSWDCRHTGARSPATDEDAAGRALAEN